MQNFEFVCSTNIIFGKGTENETGSYLKKYGAKKVLFHYGGGSIKRFGLYDKILKSLKDNDIKYFELGGVMPNPRLSMVYEGIKLCRSENIDFILAVGGGSVIDSAKAIGVGVPYDGDVWDFFAEKAQPESCIPIATVLTIPAAGSESSDSMVITKITENDGWFKRGAGSPYIAPKFSILNPELTFTLPPYQTACGISDMMAHIMERYFTNELNVDLTDRLSEAALKSVIINAPKVLADPEDYAARAELMWAGSLAHNGLMGTGRIEDWSSHRIEHELSAKYDVAHGAGLSVIFPAWMKYVYKHDLRRFVRFAVEVWNIDNDTFDPEGTALRGINAMTAFFSSIGLPVTISELGADAADFEEMAEKCIADENGCLGSFVVIDKAARIAIYKLADN